MRRVDLSLKHRLALMGLLSVVPLVTLVPSKVPRMMLLRGSGDLALTTAQLSEGRGRSHDVSVCGASVGRQSDGFCY